MGPARSGPAGRPSGRLMVPRRSAAAEILLKDYPSWLTKHESLSANVFIGRARHLFVHWQLPFAESIHLWGAARSLLLFNIYLSIYLCELCLGIGKTIFRPEWRASGPHFGGRSSSIFSLSTPRAPSLLMKLNFIIIFHFPSAQSATCASVAAIHCGDRWASSSAQIEPILLTGQRLADFLPSSPLQPPDRL